MNSNYPLRVAVVSPNYGLIGGAESFACELTERLAEKEDFDIHVFASQWCSGKAPVTFHKIPVIPFPRWFRPFSFACFVQRKILSGQYDIVHSHERIFKFDILTFHGIPHKTWIKEVRRKSLSLFDLATSWIEKKGINSSELPMIFPVSDMSGTELLKVYDIPESRFRVINPGVCLKRFSILDPNACRHEIRQRYGLSSDDIVVLFVGMNFESKRLELAINAINESVAKAGKTSKFKLLVIGKGNMKPYLSMAQEFGIADRIIFAGVTRDIEKYYMASDIFVMLSKIEAFGMVVLEAMAAGLPVVITQKVGARDIVRPGISGSVVSENPLPGELGDAIISMTDREKRIKMGEIGKNIALNHDWDVVASQMENVYRIAGNKSRGKI